MLLTKVMVVGGGADLLLKEKKLRSSLTIIVGGVYIAR